METRPFADGDVHLRLSQGWEEVERPEKAVTPLRAVFEKDRARMMLMCFDPTTHGAYRIHGVSVALVRTLVQGAIRVAGPVEIPGSNDRPILEAYEGDAQVEGEAIRTSLLIASRAPAGSPQCSLIIAAPAENADSVARDLVQMAQTLGE